MISVWEEDSHVSKPLLKMANDRAERSSDGKLFLMVNCITVKQVVFLVQF